ncbi:hypothetical protein SLEP1_g27495 [Rubroshorea leprosula]|uniref:Uncharacterized protein n=1 Tax=Rubroshorea leprosula TaxID=152421 RepID=A0AAV5JZW3_9ROSI|nr:hypothetical protein SLEP1_g27495 [Rubroshorea leprosula]
MNLLSLTTFLISLLHVLLPSTTAAPYNATDIIVLNCGASSTTTSLDGRKWEADLLFKYSPFNDKNASFPSNASSEHPSVPMVPYFSGRIIFKELIN